ncbi:PASTA domain-containing protein [Tenacibaculum sp.]|nr:PASTA domain-containing protein [Tenacibaculum sp.]
MASIYNMLTFKCQLQTSNNEAIEQYKFDIEYLDVFDNKWGKLKTEITGDKGRLMFTYKIPSRIPKTAVTPRIIRECVASGSVPMFRIVKSNKEKSLVISQSPSIVFNKEKGNILIDFQKQWLLDSSLIIERKEEVIVASLLPLHKINQPQQILKDSVSRLQNEIVKYKTAFLKEKERLGVEIAELTEGLKKQKEIEVIGQRILKQKVNEVAILKEDLEGLKNSNVELINALKLQLEEKKAEIETLKKKQLQIQKDKKTIEEALKKTSSIITIGESTIDDLVQKNKMAEGVITAKELEISRIKNIEIVKNKEIENLKEKIKEIKEHIESEHPNKLDAKTVYGNIISDIAMADEQMATSRFKLANISMNLKATVEKGPEGTLLGLLDFESAKEINGAAISDISIDIVPNETAIRNKNSVPSVIGFTETAARRELVDYGLKLDVIYQPTNNPKFIEGQAIKQSPAAGETLVKGQEVIVIFAKPLKN